MTGSTFHWQKELQQIQISLFCDHQKNKLASPQSTDWTTSHAQRTE
jgi:hypothetical protein